MKKYFKELCFFAYILFAVISCSDVKVNITTVYPQFVYEYASRNSAPSVKLSVFAEVTSGDKRIQSVTIKNTTSGMSWTADSIEVVSGMSSRKLYAGYSSFCMPASQKFDKAVYQVIYEDKAGHTTDALFSLNQEDADKYASTALSKTDKQYLVVGKNGEILYTGAATNAFGSQELVKQDFPDAAYYREYVLNVDLKAIYLMPIVELKK